MNKTLIASLESIDFQSNSTFLTEMAMQFDTLIAKPELEMFNKVAPVLSKITKKHTGMNCKFHFAKMGQPNAFVIVPTADIAAPMRPESIATKVKSYGRPVSEQELFKGIVDIKNAKVSGIYSEIPIDIFFAVELFTTRRLMDMGQNGYHIASTALHEIGHGFTYLRYLGNFVISNIVVAEITRRQHEGGDDKVIAEVVKVAEQKTGWRLRELGEINRSTDPLVIQQIVMAGMVTKIRSELGTKFYDRRAFEFAADQFVARFGGARYNVESLDIIYRAFPGTAHYRSDLSNIMLSIQSYSAAIIKSLWYGVIAFPAAATVATAAKTTSLIMAGVSAATFGLPLAAAVAISLGVAGASLLFTMFSNSDDGVYDKIPLRYEAMRRELIAYSKKTDLVPEQRQAIVDDIKVIDDILAGLSKGLWSHPSYLGNYLIDIFSGMKGQHKFQLQLERLVNNKMFELSNQLQSKTV